MATILLAIILIVVGLKGLLPALNTQTINAVVWVACIIDGILFLAHI
jgi:hypothetical protein